MAEAFTLEGHTTTLLTGSYAERVAKIKKIDPSKYDLLYSENSNIPIHLATPNHIPLIKNEEINFLKKLKIPKGVYYRDIFWTQKEYLNNMGLLKGAIGKVYYKKEITFYKDHFDKVFVQTPSFEKQIPTNLRPQNIAYLPPAGEASKDQIKPINKTIKLIYVGSCLPPVYDMIPLLNQLNKIPNIEATIITRKKDKDFLLNNFKPQQNIKLIEASGQKLETQLKAHHIGIMCPENTPYWDITLPFKFYEYLSYNCPLIGKGNNEITKEINANNIGVSINQFDELETAIKTIQNKYSDFQQACNIFKSKNTWQNRVQHIIKNLSKP